MTQEIAMCGRFTLSSSINHFIAQFGLKEIAIEPHYNIAPGQMIWGIRQIDGCYELKQLRWGFIPHWQKREQISTRYINARAETVEQVPLFKRAFSVHRCLILADGFYEWSQAPNKQPFLFRMKDQAVFGMAGIWSHWHSDDQSIDSCSIIVTSANQKLQNIHERMPVVLRKNEYMSWLDTDQHDIHYLKHFLRPYPATQTLVFPVNKVVNNPRHDTPDCILPLRQAE